MIKEQLLELLVQGKVKDLFSELKKISSLQSNYFTDPLILLQSRFNRNENENNDGLMTKSEYNVERNRIENAIRSLFDSEFEEQKIPNNYQFNLTIKKEENMFSLIDLNKFLKDWKHGDVYYKTSENFDKVLAISKLAYTDAKTCFENDLDLTKEIVQVWELANKKANQTRNWSDVNELIEYLISYAESKNEASEVDSTMTKEQELSNVAMTCLPDQATNAIFEYLKYQCSFLHNDKQIVIEGKWSKAQQPDKLKNVWTKSTYIRNLRETFVTGFKYL